MSKGGKGWMSAEDLMKQLSADPEYVRMREERNRRSRERAHCLDALRMPILSRLTEAGFPADSIMPDLVSRYAPLPEAAVTILLDSLVRCEDDAIRESIVRALAATNVSFDGRPLLECYRNTSSPGLQFAVLNTIACTTPHSIDDWIEEARKDGYLRETLSNLGLVW